MFTPYDTLKNRTFVGLIISQFLAAFNDQAIHAAAMFYAIRSDTLTEAQAISLMPILFYLPWAIFCTIAGYFADRFSKRYSLILWKIAEVAITAVAVFGFWLGSVQNNPVGPWIVLATVFLMGTHSAFFVPAKYGVLPEILHPNLLSKANGVLEGTSFLAVILGTVTGGVLSFVFNGKEVNIAGQVFSKHQYYIGLILFGLAVIGAGTSFLIRWMPAANPHRRFPWNLVKPLYQNLLTMQRSPALGLAVLGIAFFTFMVAFMRGTVYMHGETHHWTEFMTSVIVGTVAFGIGIGNGLAGVLSGHKVELGLVPLGAVGMILATFLAGMAIFSVPLLVAGIILIGFFSGFYIVPLYTLLQQRAPKTSKGDLIATSNFLNVTGAICASLLFFTLAGAARRVGIAKPVEQAEVASGTLEELRFEHGRPSLVRVKRDDGRVFRRGKLKPADKEEPDVFEQFEEHPAREPVILAKKVGLFERIQIGDRVEVTQYNRGQHEVYEVRRADQPAKLAYDEEMVPRYLFMAASLMTLGILILLCRKLPDFFVRSLLWLRSYGRYHIRVHGLNHLPTEGPAILATNCHRFQDSMHVIACTDRTVRFLLHEEEHEEERTPFLRFLARMTGMIVLEARATKPGERERAVAAGVQSLQRGDLVGLSADRGIPGPDFEAMLTGLRSGPSVPIVPVFCGKLEPTDERPEDIDPKALKRIRVVIGESLPADVGPEAISRSIDQLAHMSLEKDRLSHHPSAGHPELSAASPSKPAESPRAPQSPA